MEFDGDFINLLVIFLIVRNNSFTDHKDTISYFCHWQAIICRTSEKMTVMFFISNFGLDAGIFEGNCP